MVYINRNALAFLTKNNVLLAQPIGFQIVFNVLFRGVSYDILYKEDIVGC